MRCMGDGSNAGAVQDGRGMSTIILYLMMFGKLWYVSLKVVCTNTEPMT